MFPSPDTSARATPSLQWVPWPPLAGALRFPTFTGTMGFYDCSRSIRNPSGRPLESRTSPHEEEIASSLRFLGHPYGACLGLGTPASRPDLANSGRCREPEPRKASTPEMRTGRVLLVERIPRCLEGEAGRRG